MKNRGKPRFCMTAFLNLVAALRRSPCAATSRPSWACSSSTGPVVDTTTGSAGAHLVRRLAARRAQRFVGGSAAGVSSFAATVSAGRFGELRASAAGSASATARPRWQLSACRFDGSVRSAFFLVARRAPRLRCRSSLASGSAAAAASPRGSAPASRRQGRRRRLPASRPRIAGGAVFGRLMRAVALAATFAAPALLAIGRRFRRVADSSARSTYRRSGIVARLRSDGPRPSLYRSRRFVSVRRLARASRAAGSRSSRSRPPRRRRRRRRLRSRLWSSSAVCRRCCGRRSAALGRRLFLVFDLDASSSAPPPRDKAERR